MPRSSQEIGVPGVYLFSDGLEQNPKLSGTLKYRTYSNMVSNCEIVGTGVRHFLGLLNKSPWRFEGENEDLATEMFLTNPQINWAQSIRQLAMYRFFGFAVQEWALDRDNWPRLLSARPQSTITRWEYNSRRTRITGIVQTDPNTQREILLPRWKCVYLADNSIAPGPEGFGLFRQLVKSADALNIYEDLEKLGFVYDLRGVPVGRAPLAELQAAIDAGQITQDVADSYISPLKEFMQKHARNPQLGMILDSSAYEDGDSGNVSSVTKWDLDLLRSQSTGLPELNRTVGRIILGLARLMGIEHVLLGEGSVGSFALSRDKTQTYYLLVDSALHEIRTALIRDLITPVWALNGLGSPPNLLFEPTTFRDISLLATGVKELAAAEAALGADDPAIINLRALLGLT